LLCCLLVLPGIEATNSLGMTSDSLPVSENVPMPRDGERSESETETLVGSLSANRRFAPTEARSLLLRAKLSLELRNPAISSVSHPFAPSCELDNRNGVGAPLRC
jgi:hypothetical protein